MLSVSKLKDVHDCSSSYVLAWNRSGRGHWYVHLTLGEFVLWHICTMCLPQKNTIVSAGTYHLYYI